MRDQTYYYASGASLQEQEKQIKFAARELAEQAIEKGYIIEGTCNLSSQVMVMDVLCRRELLPKEICMEWKDEIFADKLKVKELKKSGQIICYYLGLSDEFRHSHHYRHWLHSIYSEIDIGNVFAEPLEEQREESLPYLFTDRSGKAIMFEYFKDETAIPLSNISLDECKVYEMISDSVKFEGDTYLPDDAGFDLGIWGFPGVGTKRSAQALQETGRIDSFNNLVEATRTALSFTAIADEHGDCVRREVPITEAVLEALVAYYMAWYYLYDSEIWKDAYQEAYLNPIYMKEWELENYDGNLLIEKSRKEYWEKLFSLENPETRSEIDYYKDYLAPFSTDIDTVVQFIEKISIREGKLAIERYGRLVLQGTYLDFWKWLYEDTPYQKDEVLAQIACYAENDNVRENKQKLFEALEKFDVYAASDLEMQVSFHSDKPKLGYTQRRRMVARNVEIENNRLFKELQTYSHCFTKFSIETESAELFRQSTKKECMRYLREIANQDLCRLFILYYPSQRDWIMESISRNLNILILRDMKEYVQSRDFSLDACEKSEQKIAAIIKTIRESLFDSHD